MEIVVLDGYTENPGDLSWDAVKSFGTLTVYDRTPADDAIICKRIGNADIVITESRYSGIQHSYLWYNGCWSVCYCHAA